MSYKRLKNKILWKTPKEEGWSKVKEKEIDDLCFKNCETGDIRIERSQYGRTIKFNVFRLEKVGIQTEGIDTLTRQRAIEELKKVLGE